MARKHHKKKKYKNNSSNELFYTPEDILSELTIYSLSDEYLAGLAFELVIDTVEIFQRRYLLSSLGFMSLAYDTKRIDLFNYVYDEFEHLFLSDKYIELKESKISQGDLDNMYLACLDIVIFMIKSFIKDNEDE